MSRADLGTDNVPLVLVPVLVGKLESLNVLALPDSELLAQTLVTHL